MVIVDPEDLNCAETGAIGWILSVLAIVVAEMETTDFLMDHFAAWRMAERFFVEFFGFLFDNTSQCYLCVCLSLSLTLYF